MIEKWPPETEEATRLSEEKYKENYYKDYFLLSLSVTSFSLVSYNVSFSYNLYSLFIHACVSPSLPSFTYFFSFCFCLSTPPSLFFYYHFSIFFSHLSLFFQLLSFCRQSK